MFFHEDYTGPDDGLEPERPEKTGPARFWELIQSEFAAVLKLNLIFAASCILVVTIPPALLALHQVTRQIVLGQSPSCLRDYRAAFRQGWKAAYGAFALTALPMAVSAVGAWFYLSRAAEHLVLLAPFALCATVFLVTMLSSTYLYGMLCSGKTLREAVRPALILGVAKPLRAVLAALCYYGLTLLAALFFPLSGLYLLLLGFSLPCLLGNFYIRTVLKQYCGA